MQRAEERERARVKRELEDANEAALALQPMDDDLDALFAAAPGAGGAGGVFMSLEVPPDANVHVTTPQYRLVEGEALLKQMAQLLAMHFHVVNGEPMDEVYNIESHLFVEPTTPIFHT